MKRILLIIFILFSTLYAKEYKSINAVLGEDKPPFMFAKTTQKGIEADLLREIFNNMGYKLNIIQKEKSYLQIILNQKNEFDLVATITPKNEKLFYSNVFTTYENYVITRDEDHLRINSIDDLQSIRFVTWHGAYNDLNDKFYKLFNPINGTSRYSYNESLLQIDDLKMFFSKKVDAIIIDKTIFNWYKIHMKDNGKYKFHNIFKEKKTYPVTFRSKELRDKFNIELEKLKKSGRYNAIIRFYETQDVNELLKFTTLISNISSKFIYENKSKELITILKSFFTHPDIIAIQIKDKNNKIVLSLNANNQQYDYNKFPRTTEEINYNNGKLINLGKVNVYYKKDYKTNNGGLIPFINRFLNNTNFNYIQDKYKKLNIIDNKRILLTKEEKEYLFSKKTITVHNESVWAPYNFNENAIPKGYVIDYMDLIAKKLGINIKYISGYSWSEYINLIKTEQIDIISNIAKTKDRENFINFTKPFLKSKKAIFSNTLKIKKLSELNGKTVAVPNQFYIHLYLKKHYPKINIKTYKNIKECIYAVINKEADVVIENYAVVNYLMKKDGLSMKYISISDNAELYSDLSIGVRKSQVILRDILIKAQDSLTKKEIDIIEDKWFGLGNQKDKKFTPKQRKYINKKKSIKVCTNPNWVPLEYNDNNKPKGIAIDILNLISKKTTLKINYIRTQSWKQSQEFLRDKKCDILSSVIKTKKREEYLNFTKPYISYDLAIITRNDKPLVDNISTIVDETMSRKAASGISMILKQQYPNINIKNTNNMLESFQDIQNGSSYFTIATLPVLSYNIKKYDFNNLQVAGYLKLKYDLRIGVRKDDKELLGILNNAINMISKDTIKIINNKWTTQEVIKQADYTLAIIIFIIAFIIISIIIVMYMKQRDLSKEIEDLNDSLKSKVESEIAKNHEREKFILHQSRLAQMGEIISMIAHQWRQPLNTLSMLNQSVVLKYQRGKLDKEFLDYFKDNSKIQINNMSTTIDDFRNFFKPEKEKSTFCINDNIENTIELVSPVFLKEDISINIDYNEKFITNGFPNELGQAILNIINNAKDALIENKIENKKIEILLYRKDENIIIIIKDNAKGIPLNIINNVFDPYFSTKKEKDGTGLGLYMSKMIIEDHCNGRINVSNNKDGAVFELILKENNE